MTGLDAPTLFAQRLRQARERAGLTQHELGLRAGMDPSVASPRVNQYERGAHVPKPETAEALADVLGIPAAFLYTRDEQLAQLLLRWPELTAAKKRSLLKLALDDSYTIAASGARKKSEVKPSRARKKPSGKQGG